MHGEGPGDHRSPDLCGWASNHRRLLIDPEVSVGFSRDSDGPRDQINDRVVGEQRRPAEVTVPP